MNKWKTPLNANRMNKSDEWTDELWFYGASTSWIFLSKNTTSVLCLRLRVSHQSLLLLVFIVIGSAVMSFYMNSVLKAARGHRAGGSSFWASFVPDCYHHRRTQQIHSHANEWSQMTWIGDTQLQLKEKKNKPIVWNKSFEASLHSRSSSQRDPAGPTHSAVRHLSKFPLLRTFNATQLHLINFKCCSLQDNRQNTVACIQSASLQNVSVAASSDHTDPGNIKDE